MSKKKKNNFYQSNKVLLWIFIIIVCFILGMKYLENKNDNKPVEGDIKLVIEPRSNVTIGIGNTINLKAIINVDDAIINWVSSDTSIATISNGNVTGIKYGSARITAMYIDNSGKRYEDSIYISVVEGNPDISLESVRFPTGDLYMSPNSEYTLTLTLTPSNALISDKYYISSDDDIISVSPQGVVKSLKEGHAKVIVNVNSKYKTSIDVYVSKDFKKSGIVLSPTSISLSNDSKKIKLGNSERINYNVTPSNANLDNLIWTSSDSNIVSVNDEGVIIAKKVGKAVISVTSINGKRDDMTVEVYNDVIEVKDIVITTDTIEMKAGTMEVITPVVSPDNATDKGLVYSSSDSNVVSIYVSGKGTDATLSALQKGSAIITIKSGNIEKKVTVNVTGDGGNNAIDDGTSNHPTTIKLTSNKNNFAKSYDEVKNIPVPGTTNISVQMRIGVGKIKYCINKYGSTLCNPNIELYSDDIIEIPSGAIYVLRVIKYDYSDNEITSSSPNYIDGVLNYYINTESDEKTKQYSVDKTFENVTAAMLVPQKIGDKVKITISDKTRYLKICATTETNCVPSIKVNNDYYITLNKVGIWRIFVIEYDNNNQKIGNMGVYYAYVKENTPVPTGDNIDNVKVSNLKINNDSKNGRYLSIDMVSDINFYSPRFCYIVVNKGVEGTCNLDLTSTSVTYYNNGNIVRPKEEFKTYYATIASTKQYTFKYYLSGLDQIYNSGDINKDVIFEFAVRSTKGYSKPIRIRINMTSKTSSGAYWNTSIIK